MDSISKNLHIFKSEADDLLTQLEDIILKAEEAPSDPDILNQLFRIIHTLKGSSDMFGFKQVTTFTHLLEAVLEEVREGKIKLDKSLIDIVLSSKDFIKHLLTQDQEGENLVDNHDLTKVLKAILDGQQAQANISSTDDQEPSLAQEETTNDLCEYHITLTPSPAIFLSGADPADLLAELNDLGSCKISALTNSIPTIDIINPEECYLMWEIYLTTYVDLQTIEDVFIFLDDDEFAIKEVDNLCFSSPKTEPAPKVAVEIDSAASSSQADQPAAPAQPLEEDYLQPAAPPVIEDEDLLKEFVTESREHLETIEEDLLQMEEQQDNLDIELVNKVFRSIHSMKGASGFLNLVCISKLSHLMETLLSMIRSGDIKPEKKYIEVLLEGVDHLNRMLDDIPNSNSYNISSTLKNLDILIRGISNDVSQAMDTTISIPGKDENELAFTIDELTYHTLHQSGQFIYILKYDLKQFEKQQEMSIKQLISELVSLGNIIETKVDYPRESLQDSLEKMSMRIEILYSSVIDPSLIQDAVKLDNSSIQQVDESLITQTSGTSSPAASQPPAVSAPPQPASQLMQQAPPPQKAPSKDVQLKVKETIRVPSERLDTLVNLVGEMVITQASLAAANTKRNYNQIEAAVEEMDRLIAELRDNVLTIRMMPIGSTFSRFRRLVRDLSADLGKQIVMETEGAETELDKTVLDKLADPLVHLIRNSIDHGIESPEDRKQANKPTTGKIRLSAEHTGAHVVITIEDDGKGLNVEAIRSKAIERGLISKHTEMTEHEIFQQIFAPGFSTAKTVSNVSGRGVGMDVVKRQIESLRGSIDITSNYGQGTSIALSLPLTLAIIDGLLVRLDNDRYIIPLSAVKESVELTRSERESNNNRNLIHVRGSQIPYVRLRDLFDAKEDDQDLEYVVIVEYDEKLLGIVVDKVLGNHQTVIKSLGSLYKNVDVVSGATIMGDGQVALILDIAGLLKYKSLREEELSL